MESVLSVIDRTIRTHGLLSAGDAVIVACSGGADSVALLVALHELRERLGIRALYAFHLNHMLRGGDAERDQRFTEELCETLGIPCVTERVDVPRMQGVWDVSFEEAGRIARYRALAQLREQLAEQCGQDAQAAVWIATGHQREDVAETFFLNLFRGSGLDGLASIAYRHGAVIRPMLSISRREIESFLTERGIAWCDDATNRDTAYRRNRLRNDLFPLLSREYGVDVASMLARTTELLKQDRDYLEQRIAQRAREAVKPPLALHDDPDALHSAPDAPKRYRIDAPETLHPAEYSRLLRAVIHALLGSLRDVSSHDIGAIRKLERVGGMLTLRGGLTVRRTYQGIELSVEGAGDATSPSGELIQEQYRIGDIALEDYGRDVAIVDADKIAGALQVRRRMPGDRFVPLGMQGSQSLKKFMINHKIDRRERDRLRIVVDEEKIIWIEGHRLSEEVKVDRDTKRLLLLRFG